MLFSGTRLLVKFDESHLNSNKMQELLLIRI